MYRQFKSPFSAQLELTTECNHKCIHCYNHWRKCSSEDKTLNESEIEAIIVNLKESEVPSLLITGGEPMLYPDLMFKAFEVSEKMGIKCSLNSNLTLVTEDIAKKLKRFKSNVLTSILSFDGKLHDSITTSQGSFRRLLEGIKILQRYEVPIGANMVVMQKNVNQIYATGKFVHDLGIDTFRATKVHPAQGSSGFEKIKLPPEKISVIFDELLRLKSDFGLKVDSLTTYPICLLKDLERYGEFLIKRSCSAGKTGCTIGADGQIRPCGHSDYKYGNAIKESILDIWPRLKEWRDGSLLPIECKECKYLMQCSGGCRMDCKFYGKIDDMDPYATSNEFTLIPQTQKGVSLLGLNEDLIVNPSLVLRKEDCGVTLISNGKVLATVSHDSAKLLSDLNKRSFTISDIVNNYNVDFNSMHLFFSNLYKRKVIKLLVSQN